MQCRMFLDSTPLSLSEKFIQQVTLVFRSLVSFEKALPNRGSYVLHSSGVLCQ